ncbi:MAG: response regulator [Burkholderiaceae bacterium]
MDSPPEDAGVRGRRTILVIDDHAELRETTVMLLELAGYHALEAADGPSGMRLAQACGPDLVLLDYAMPAMSGAEVGAALRRDPRTRAIKILMHTGTREQVVRAAFDGYDGFLSKPVDSDRLFQAIGSALDQARS